MENQDAEQASLDEYVEEAKVESVPQEEVTEAKAEETPAVEIPEVVVEEVAETEKVDGFQKRINKVTADKWQEKRRADALQAQLDTYSQQQVQQPKDEELTLESYDYDEDAYQSAVIDQKVRQGLQHQAQVQAQEGYAQEQENLARKFQDDAAKFAADKPDFQEVISQVPTLHPAVLEAIQRSGQAPEIAYHLGSNLDAADSIAQMDVGRGLMELGKISALLSQPKSVKASSAPEPINAIQSSGVVESDIGDEMSMEDWMAKYNSG